jgi:hypothetical protein
VRALRGAQTQGVRLRDYMCFDSDVSGDRWEEGDVGLDWIGLLAGEGGGGRFGFVLLHSTTQYTAHSIA